MKTVIMFSGQGSQYPNMGIDFLELENNQEKINIANNILGFDIKEAIKNNNNELSSTKYNQPLMTVIMMLMFDYYKSSKFDCNAVLGFSLGEYAALYASGIYSFNDIVEIVKKRALYMEEAALENKGMMAAVLTNDLALIEEVCSNLNKDNEVLVIANYNSKSQFVISGTVNAINKSTLLLKEKGVKRVIPLNVSGAFHSPLMANAGKRLYSDLGLFKKNKMEIPIYLNKTANIANVDELELRLMEQVYSPVLFYQTIDNLILEGYDNFIEIGPGKVLSQLVSRNYKNVTVNTIEKITDF